ncbi:hypothetical protein Patl1_06659 [Pistacia atlantica]|uniref:Uncharacterized protein n=1 Tax=Pistacia atlantica TaxID=434234 RepID=A0ACC1BUU0_9ROSI|nr:hypothetical protein Patl1_06659 [Pistacia atlantica]
MVYCQSCEHYGTWSLSEAETIASAKVKRYLQKRKGSSQLLQVFSNK